MSAPERVYRAGDGTLWDRHDDATGKALAITQPGPWFYRGDHVWLTRAQVEQRHGPLRPQVVLDEDKVRGIMQKVVTPRRIYTADIGKCEECGDPTSSGGIRLHNSCALDQLRALLASIPSVEDDPK